jgi:hypothetical protein
MTAPQRCATNGQSREAWSEGGGAGMVAGRITNLDGAKYGVGLAGEANHDRALLHSFGSILDLKYAALR